MPGARKDGRGKRAVVKLTALRPRAQPAAAEHGTARSQNGAAWRGALGPVISVYVQFHGSTENLCILLLSERQAGQRNIAWRHTTFSVLLLHSARSAGPAPL